MKIPRVTYSEAKANIESLRYFLQTTEINDEVFSAIATMQQFVNLIENK